MPNGVGLYTLAEMRELVRRRLGTYQAGRVDVATGSEDPEVASYIDPVITNTDINFELNAAVVRRGIEVSILDESLLTEEAFFDVEEDIVEYELPEDLLFLRGLYWLPTDRTATLVPSDSEYRLPMHYVDGEGPSIDKDGVPTFRRRQNFIVLNAAPTSAATSGILIDYVKWMLYLEADDQVLETQFARILQEVIVLDAAIALTVEKLHLDAAELVQMAKSWGERLVLATQSSLTPKIVDTVPVTPFIKDWRVR